jgi:hypothetical protein
MAFAAAGTAGLIGAGVAGLAGLGQMVSGFSQKRQANKALKKAKDPGYVIPEEYSKNLGIAENLAKTGMPSEQYNQAQTNIQRGSQTGLRQLGRMSNPFAAIQGLARGQQEAGMSLDVANAAARRQNILGAMGARREMAQQNLAKQQYGQQRYMDEMNRAYALKGAGMQNIAGGLRSIGSTGMTAMSGGLKPSSSYQTSAFGDQAVS